MNIRALHQKDFLVWLLLIIMFYAQGSGVLDITSSVTTPFVLLFFVLCIYIKYQISIPNYIFVCFGILLVNHLITGITSGANFSEGFNITTWLQMLWVCLSAYLVYMIDGSNAAIKFVKLVTFFAVISLICYTLAQFGFGSVLMNSFRSRWSAGTSRVFYGKWLYAYNPRYERNNGVFLEPGVYQVTLTAALYVLILCDSISKEAFGNKRGIFSLIIAIALITTKSTTGYIGLLVILAGFFFKRKSTRDYSIGVLVLMASIFLIYDYYAKGSSSLIQTYLLNKFTEISDRGVELSSGGARIVAMQLGIKAASEHLFGIGYLEWQNQIQMIYGRKFGTGNALFGQLGIRGIIAFGVSLYLAIMPAIRCKSNKIEILVYIFLFVNIATAQSMIIYPAIMLIGYLGIDKDSSPFNGKVLTIGR